MNVDRRRALKIVAGLAACPLCGVGAVAAEGPAWGYEGDTGPDHWGQLDPANSVCGAGTQESPIDVRAAIEAKLPPLKIEWAGTADTIVNNGHTIQLKAAPNSRLTLGDDQYELLQFHFHRPSEHLVDGRRFPMEVHFVHQHAASGGLAVVGVLITPGKANPAFAKLVATMPAKHGPATKADPGIDPNGLLPNSREYYCYNGSLTTPPCSETVAWLLLTQPIEVGEADIASFAQVYPMNARPVQKENRRFVLRSG